ncbi:MAG: D-glycero-beta-D-manno-heptose 1-phosphate adenylyltransferase [Pirellulales bacterium]|nr:D-glycero-beta-D-manno-heptose 1-phosphate adenylyltransferase [Pirellulales bacterium]
MSQVSTVSQDSSGRILKSYTTKHKILTVEWLDMELAARRSAGQRIVMTNGCFDLLHPGHVASLEQARAQGDCLVVGLNSDASVRKLKGPDRPIVDEHGRSTMLAALQCVDYVVLFDDTSVLGLVERILPDVLVKSAQYTLDEVVGREVVEATGGRVELTPMTGGYSTTRLLERIQAAM